MTIHFLLTLDSSSARRLKRLLAEHAARVGVVIGTWRELVNLAADAYLVPLTEGTWDEQVSSVARTMEEMFWSKSLEVAEVETIRAVSGTLRMLIEGTVPDNELSGTDNQESSERARRHFNDLIKLHENTDKSLPDDLKAIRNILAQPANEALRRIRVYALENLPRLNPWQSALVEKLNNDCVKPPEADLESLIQGVHFSHGPEDCSNTARVVAEKLYEPVSIPVPLDSSVQWLGVRDHIEEAEVACGIVQGSLEADPDLSLMDFALLLPVDREYTRAVGEVFQRAGLPLSGLQDEPLIRDLGREVILYFIICRRRPAPNMALAALLSSPLMPWPDAIGHSLAQCIMDGHYDLELDNKIDKGWHRVLYLVRQTEEKPAELSSAIKEFSTLLTSDDEMADHLTNAKSVAQEACSLLSGAKNVPWEDLLKTVSPQSISESRDIEMTQESIAVFTEHQEPWRQVKQLLVLGFAEGRYPGPPSRSPVFFDEDIVSLKECCDLDVETQADILKIKRKLFKRQLASADKLTFLVPRRNGSGGSLTPSQSLPFMARLFEGVDKPEKLIFDLEKDADRERALGIALAPEGVSVPPRRREVSDLNFTHDLAMLRTDDEGNPKPQSPSRLGKLMSSPFAWLLESAGITARDWGPEELSVMEKGTLAHDVFEHLFAPGKTLPGEKRIISSVNRLLNEAIIRISPYMLAPEWITERKNLEGEIITAALAWGRILKAAGAKVVEVEPWIRGSFDNFPIYGKADAILSLESGRILVVDYKKSGSGARREQMRKGFDSQTSLYRTMLQTGVQDRGLADALSNNPEVGVLYYLLNDQTALTDTSGWLGSQVAGVEEMGEDISINAIALIKERLAEIRRGYVRLNTTGDEQWFKRTAGLTIYALDDSPLIRLFVREENE